MPIITTQKLIDADKDADSLKTFISGSDFEDVITRLNKVYPTLAKMIRMMLDGGFFRPFSTEAELLNYIPAVIPSAAYALDTGKVWIYESRNSAVRWYDEGLSTLDRAKKLNTETNTGLANINVAIHEISRTILQIIGLIKDGDSFTLDVNEILNNLNVAQQTQLLSFIDYIENHVDGFFDEQSKFDRLSATQDLIQFLQPFVDFKPDVSLEAKPVLNNIYSFSAAQNIIVIDADIPSVPESKGNPVSGNASINIDGQVFSSHVTVDVQGSSSAGFPKKNLTFEFYGDKSLKNSNFLKIGDMLEHSTWVYKANWIDTTHFRNIGSYRIWEQIMLSRNVLPKRDIEQSYVGKIGIDSVETGATGHPIGYPCIVYVKSKFYGVGNFNIGKKRGNYNIAKNNPKEIYLELNHWAPIEDLDLELIGWNGSLATEVKSPSKMTPETEKYLQDWRDFASLPNNEFKLQFTEHLDAVNTADFYLLCYFICAVDLMSNDSLSKNFNFITWNGQKWFFMPYDLDSTFGLHVGGISIEYPPTHEMATNGFWEKIRITLESDIEKRYAELRKDIFTVDNVYKTYRKLSSNYSKEMFDAEFKKWPDLPSKNITNMSQVLDWARQRLDFLDTKFNFKG